MRARDNRTQPSPVWAIGPIVAFALVLIGSIIQWTSERVDVSNVVLANRRGSGGGREPRLSA